MRQEHGARLTAWQLVMPALGTIVRAYAATAFGPRWGFVVGWLYWTGLALALSSEATAAALFARYWTPGLPLWAASLAVIALVTVLNLLDLRLFSVIETAMAAVKLLAVIAFG